MFCLDISNPIFVVFSKDVPHLLYYSHIPAATVSLLLGIFVFLKNKKEGLYLMLLSISFALWVFINLIVWTNNNSSIIMFAWSFFGVLLLLICFFSNLLLYYFLFKKEVSIKWKTISLLIISPFVLLAGSNFYLTNFLIGDCGPTENLFYSNSYYILGLLYLLVNIIVSIKAYKKVGADFKKEVLIFSFGMNSFLTIFLATGLIGSVLYGINPNYDNIAFNIEQYGLFGMVIFMAYLAFLIVRFKAFDIKLLGAQALVWSLVILIGSQFAFIQNPTNKILTAITLVISSILGLILVRSVKREIVLREHLEIANAEQTNLIHIMNHQIKGYLSISKNIFAELLTDDYGKMPDDAKDIVTQGLENADKGTRYVTAILKGDSAESGTLSYDMKPFDFKNLVSEVVAKEKVVAEKKGLQFNFVVNDGVYNITGDISHLGESVRNLIDNSINYTPSGSVSVNLSLKGSKILLQVKDTGVGVKAEDAPKLFKAGGVGSDSIKINTNSSGYGLAFVKGVIEKHGGRVWFESAGAGFGSTFYIELPVK